MAALLPGATLLQPRWRWAASGRQLGAPIVRYKSNNRVPQKSSTKWPVLDTPIGLRAHMKVCALCALRAHFWAAHWPQTVWTLCNARPHRRTQHSRAADRPMLFSGRAKFTIMRQHFASNSSIFDLLSPFLRPFEASLFSPLLSASQWGHNDDKQQTTCGAKLEPVLHNNWAQKWPTFPGPVSIVFGRRQKGGAAEQTLAHPREYRAGQSEICSQFPRAERSRSTLRQLLHSFFP